MLQSVSVSRCAEDVLLPLSSWAISCSPTTQHQAPHGQPWKNMSLHHSSPLLLACLTGSCLPALGPGKHEKYCGDERWKLL